MKIANLTKAYNLGKRLERIKKLRNALDDLDENILPELIIPNLNVLPLSQETTYAVLDIEQKYIEGLLIAIGVDINHEQN